MSLIWKKRWIPYLVVCPSALKAVIEIICILPKLQISSSDNKKIRPVILMNFDIQDMFKYYLKTEMLFAVKTPDEVIAKIKYLFQ